MAQEFDWVKRDRGILNERDRELLTGAADEEISENAWNQRRYNIRRRVQNSIYDFYLLSRYLPVTDIQQVFEPAYEWSREKRELIDQGLTETNPELPMFLYGWLAAIEFFSYGMHAGGKAEARGMMRDLVGEGIERGARYYQVENQKVLREVSASLDLQYGHEILWRNYIQQLQNQLPDDPDKIAEQVLHWYRERRIPYRVASHWIEEFVRKPKH